MSDIKHVLLEVQQKVRNLEKKHQDFVQLATRKFNAQRSVTTALSEKLNQQGWQIAELVSSRLPPKPVQKPSAVS